MTSTKHSHFAGMIKLYTEAELEAGSCFHKTISPIQWLWMTDVPILVLYLQQFRALGHAAVSTSI